MTSIMTDHDLAWLWATQNEKTVQIDTTFKALGL